MRVSGSASRPGARCGLGLEPVDEIDHVIEPTPGAGADATSRNLDGDAFGAERRVRRLVPKLARSTIKNFSNGFSCRQIARFVIPIAVARPITIPFRARMKL